MSLPRIWRTAAAFLAAIAVAMGAVAAHLPIERFGLPEGRDIVREAVQMQMWHALALLALGVGLRTPSRLQVLAGCMMLPGIMLFCGALYVTAFSGHHLGSVAPTGGSLLILSWIVLGVGFLACHD